MNWIRLIIIVTIPIFITILGLEFGARLILDSGDKRSRDYSDYLPKELDKSLPFIADKNGQKCIELNLGFNWNQWWGFVNRDLDLECAKRHFLDDTFNVVFMGGSAMFNREAPNFHTTIDYLAINDLKKVRSINLAESGARHMNMSVRFQREVTKLKPDLVIFFDGYNEFNSISYGGSPEDDFYWTASGKNRMLKPYRLYIDKAIELSSFLELALIHTSLYKSSRNVSNILLTEVEIEKSALTYLNDKKVTQKLCKAFEINCVFVIQPHIYGSEIDEHKDIILRHSKKIPHNEMVIKNGYKIILEGCNDCVDFSEGLNNVKKTFIDPVHFSKKGSIKVAEFFKEIIVRNMRMVN